MSRPYLLALGFLTLLSSASGDAYRGAAILEKQGCTKCHAVKGQGGHSAPDLGSRIAREYTPAAMTSVMWNHAPAMWSAMAAQGFERPRLSERDAEDLFAYFYSVRFFEKLGDAGRGKHILLERKCVTCHALSEGAPSAGKPVPNWVSITDPVMLVQQMWNHTSLMKQALASRKFKWITLSAQDLTDLSVYVQNLPRVRQKTGEFWLPAPQGVETVFREKGCAGCHQGKLALEHRLANQTLTDIAAAMWNHAPRMAEAPLLSLDEMRQIVKYVWEKQYLGVKGDARRGKHEFEKKRCANCHNDATSGAPSMAQGERVYSPVTLVSVLWQHGPSMLDAMKKKDIAWPRLTSRSVADITAYLNTRR